MRLIWKLWINPINVRVNKMQVILGCTKMTCHSLRSTSSRAPFQVVAAQHWLLMIYTCGTLLIGLSLVVPSCQIICLSWASHLVGFSMLFCPSVSCWQPPVRPWPPASASATFVFGFWLGPTWTLPLPRSRTNSMVTTLLDSWIVWLPPIIKRLRLHQCSVVHLSTPTADTWEAKP